MPCELSLANCHFARNSSGFPFCYDPAMCNLVVLFIHFIATLARLLGPGGVRSLVAESLLIKHQLLIVNRSRQRSPNLHSSDRILAGLLALLVRPTRLLPIYPPDYWVRRPCRHSMVSHSVGCSTTPFEGDAGCRSTSVPTTIHFIGSTSGQANLRIREVTEIKSVPYVPLSHPFVERLIGTLRREYLAHRSGQRQISKTSCSISGPTSTTIARITHWKGERPIRGCHDQS
jgi:hypothetical protein